MTEMKLSIVKLRAEIDNYNRTNVNTTLKSNIDYTS